MGGWARSILTKAGVKGGRGILETEEMGRKGGNRRRK